MNRTALYLVREEPVPVEELRPGDRVILPNSKRRVTVESIDEYDTGVVVNWWRPAEIGEPGHSRANGGDGRYTGTFPLSPLGHCWMVDRG